jgi:hypothetical protein
LDFAGTMASAEEYRTPQAKQDLLKNQYVMNEAVRRYGARYPGLARSALEAQILKSAGLPDEYKSRYPELIDTDEVLNMAAVASQSPNILRHEQEITQQNHWHRMQEMWARMFPQETRITPGDSQIVDAFSRATTESERQAIRDKYGLPHTRGEVVTGPMGDSVYSVTKEEGRSAARMKQLEALSKRIGGEMGAGPGGWEAPLPAHGLHLGAKYEFTSLTGLVEKMQTEAANQIFNFQQQTADNTKQMSSTLDSIDKNIAVLVDNSTGLSPSGDGRMAEIPRGIAAWGPNIA